jgi:hypothetical protein
MKQKHIRQILEARLFAASRLASMLLVVLFAVAAGTATAHATGTDPAIGDSRTSDFDNEKKKPNKENQLLWDYDVTTPIGIAIDSARGRLIISDANTALDMMIFAKGGNGGSKSNKTLGETDKDGYLYTESLDTTGRGLHPLGDHAFVDSLYKPMGMAIVEDTLYIADMNDIIAINLNDTTEVFRYEIEHPTDYIWLYDAIGDSSGNLYFSSYREGIIYRMEVGSRVADSISWIGTTLDHPSAMMFDAENNRIIYGTALFEKDSSQIMALDLENDSCYKIMELGFRNVSGITRDSDGDYYLTQAHETEVWEGSYIYKLDGDFNSPPKIISLENEDTFGMVKMIPGTDTLIFNEIDNGSNGSWVWRENLSYLQAKPTLLTPTDERDSLSYSCRFTWENNEDSSSNKSIVWLYYDDAVSTSRIYSTKVNVEYLSTDELQIGRSYKWYVQSLSHGSPWLLGACSDTNTFRTYHPDSIPVVTLVSPIDSTERVPIHFYLKWNEFPGAEWYHIETYQWSQSESNKVTYSTDDTTYSIFPALEESPYWWRVRVGGKNISSGWSEWNTFETIGNHSRLDTCKLYYPPAGDEEWGYPTNMTFEWSSVPGATE